MCVMPVRLEKRFSAENSSKYGTENRRMGFFI